MSLSNIYIYNCFNHIKSKKFRSEDIQKTLKMCLFRTEITFKK